MYMREQRGAAPLSSRGMRASALIIQRKTVVQTTMQSDLDRSVGLDSDHDHNSNREPELAMMYVTKSIFHEPQYF